MQVDDIPDVLRSFLESGAQLEYDEASCEAGRVLLHAPGGVRLRTFPAQTYGTPLADLDPHREEGGTYAVPGYDLVASCSGDYEPEGLLVWFPAEGSFGVCDTSHDYILLFGPEVRWSNIVAAPARFLNAQWAFEELDRAAVQHLAPWHHYSWNK